MPLSRTDIIQRILAGEHLLLYHGHVIRVTQAWLDRHPGGALAILHFVGRDASNEIDACHNPGSVLLVKKYSIGLVDPSHLPWIPLLPPIAAGWVHVNGNWRNEAVTLEPGSPEVLLVKTSDPARPLVAPSLTSLIPPPSALSLETQIRQSEAYKKLHQQIIDAGLYQTPFLTGYGPEFIRYILLGCMSAFTYYHNWLMTSALFLGLMWHLLAFFAHDLGHMGVTHSWTADRLISIVVADFIGGLSIGWWVDNHNIHHLVTNHPSHDPDIEHLPFFAISPKFFSSIYSTYYKRTLPFDIPSQFFVSVQHKLFYIVMLFARFNLYRLSYVHLFRRAFDTKRARGGRWAYSLELIGVTCFWLWFGALLRGCGSWKKALLYAVISHVATSPLHVQLVLSHFSMSTEDLGPTESFPHRQLRTTTDVECHPSVSWIHGGLHLQVTHHLFPRLPRHNLSKASKLVKKFAKEEGLVYNEFGFFDGTQEVVGVLKGVADQVGMMMSVAHAEAREAVDKKLKESEDHISMAEKLRA